MKKVPTFITMFRNIFVAYFLLFIVVGTIILIVSYQSNDNFFGDIESINIVR